MRTAVLHLLMVLSLFTEALPSQVFDINDKLSIGGILASTGQCQGVSAKTNSMDEFNDECRGAMPFQLEIRYHPNNYNEFFFKLGFAVGNGLNQASSWTLAPWAADLEDDLEDINGRNRDHLLTVWYKYTHSFQNKGTLGASIGIIDATDYIDGNEYANDELAQFMNEGFVNSGGYNLGSYDAGAALEWELGDWTLTGLGMNIGENDDGNNYNFWGAEVGYHPETAMGPGNYRLTVTGTSAKFSNATGAQKERLLGYGLSFDQAFGKVVGGFLRFSWQQEDAAIDYEAQYSGGLNFSGSGWGRKEDNIGIGYAYLDGGNGDIDNTQVFEAYYRSVLNEHMALTADVQHMKDDLEKIDPRQNNPSGWLFGLRFTAEF